MTHRVPALLAVCALALTGCGDSPDDDRAADPAPTASPTAPARALEPTDPAAACGGLAVADLTRIVGLTQGLSRTDEDGEDFTCRSMYDETGMIIDWQRRPVIGSFQVEGENADLNGLTRQPVELAGSPAWLLDGVVAGNRVATVVTVVGESTLVVETGNDGASDATVTDRELVRVARDVAATLIEQEESA